MKAELIFKYFTTLNEEQKEQFAKLETLYQDWNQKINVVSRGPPNVSQCLHLIKMKGGCNKITGKRSVYVKSK